MNIQKLQASVPEIKTFDFSQAELVEIMVKPYTFIRDNMLFISAEEGDGAADYYGRDGLPWINPILDAWAEKKGGYLEWENPACLVFIKN